MKRKRNYPNPQITTPKVQKPILVLPKKVEETSSNWKLLLASKVIKPAYRSKRPKMTNEVTEKSGMKEKVDLKAEVKESKGKKKRIKLPKVGLNDFGFFDYNHYGELKTPVDNLGDQFTNRTWSLAMDCEMVGVGSMKESALGRVSIVNEYGYCIYDKFVKPKMKVTDYRTQFSGIREQDLEKAVTFEEAVKKASELLNGRILVGHAIEHDLKVLFISHPKNKIRDTSRFFRKAFKGRTPALRTLTETFLNVKIQSGEHNSIQDAQAAMKLYLLNRRRWEDAIKLKRQSKKNKKGKNKEGSVEEKSVEEIKAK